MTIILKLFLNAFFNQEIHRFLILKSNGVINTSLLSQQIQNKNIYNLANYTTSKQIRHPDLTQSNVKKKPIRLTLNRGYSGVLIAWMIDLQCQSKRPAGVIVSVLSSRPLDRGLGPPSEQHNDNEYWYLLPFR